MTDSVIGCFYENKQSLQSRQPELKRLMKDDPPEFARIRTYGCQRHLAGVP
jgi:hypothetical protein